RHRVHRVVLAQHRIVVATLDVLALLERTADRESDQLPAAARTRRLADDQRSFFVLDRRSDLRRRRAPRGLVDLVLDIEDRRQQLLRLAMRNTPIPDLISGRPRPEARGPLILPLRRLLPFVGVEPRQRSPDRLEQHVDLADMERITEPIARGASARG